MTGIEIRTYDGDFEDVAAFTRRVWTDSYGGKMWFPLWDAAFLRWQFGAQEDALSPVAYHGTTLVGSILSARHALAVRGSVYPVGVLSWCTVDPAYRHFPVARRLIEAYRRRHDEQRLAFSIGVVSGDPTSIAYRFWQQYAEAYPQNFRFLLQFGTWVKALSPRVVARGGVRFWERLKTRTIAPLLQFTPVHPGPHVRPYSASDLPGCAALLQKVSARCDWTVVWSQERLAVQLDHPAAHTLVFDRGGGVQGMVNYHGLSMEGRQPVRAALIDLWADDGLGLGERTRLLGGVCDDLRRQDVHIVFAMRSALMPSQAFVANLFVPFPSHDHLIVMFPPKRELPVPKTWSLLLR